MSIKIMTMNKLNTPAEIEQHIAEKPYCLSVVTSEYYDKDVAIVFVVKVTFWTKVRCLLWSSYYRMLKAELEIVLSRNIPNGFNYQLIFEL